MSTVIKPMPENLYSIKTGKIDIKKFYANYTDVLQSYEKWHGGFISYVVFTNLSDEQENPLAVWGITQQTWDLSVSNTSIIRNRPLEDIRFEITIEGGFFVDSNLCAHFDRVTKIRNLYTGKEVSGSGDFNVLAPFDFDFDEQEESYWIDEGFEEMDDFDD